MEKAGRFLRKTKHRGAENTSSIVLWVKHFDNFTNDRLVDGNPVHETMCRLLENVLPLGIEGNVAIGSLGVEVEDCNGEKYFINSILCATNSTGGQVRANGSTDRRVTIGDGTKSQPFALFCSNSEQPDKVMRNIVNREFAIINFDSFQKKTGKYGINGLLNQLKVDVRDSVNITNLMQSHGHSEFYYLASLLSSPRILLELLEGADNQAGFRLQALKSIRKITLDVHSEKDICASCRLKFKNVMTDEQTLFERLLQPINELIDHVDTDFVTLTRVSSRKYNRQGGLKKGDMNEDLPDITPQLDVEAISTDGIVLASRIDSLHPEGAMCICDTRFNSNEKLLEHATNNHTAQLRKDNFPFFTLREVVIRKRATIKEARGARHFTCFADDWAYVKCDDDHYLEGPGWFGLKWSLPALEERDIDHKTKLPNVVRLVRDHILVPKSDDPSNLIIVVDIRVSTNQNLADSSHKRAEQRAFIKPDLAALRVAERTNTHSTPTSPITHGINQRSPVSEPAKRTFEMESNNAGDTTNSPVDVTLATLPTATAPVTSTPSRGRVPPDTTTKDSTVVVLSDSLVKDVGEVALSTSIGDNVVMKWTPKYQDVTDYVQHCDPNERLLIAVGTEHVLSEKPDTFLDRLWSLDHDLCKRGMTDVTFCGVPYRGDSKTAQISVDLINKDTKKLCTLLGWKFVDTSHLNSSHLGKDKHHLNEKGLKELSERIGATMSGRPPFCGASLLHNPVEKSNESPVTPKPPQSD